MKKKKRRQLFVLVLVVLCWGALPTAIQAANQARGGFAVGGEYALLVLPFVVAEVVFTLSDLCCDAKEKDR